MQTAHPLAPVAPRPGGGRVLAVTAGEDAYGLAADLLKALSAPVRVAIVSHLNDSGPLCVHELVERLHVAQPLVSQHLRVLRTSGIVLGRRRGREVAYELVDEHVAHIVGDAVTHAQEPACGGRS